MPALDGILSERFVTIYRVIFDTFYSISKASA